MSTKTVSELIESFRVNGDIVDFTQGMSDIIQSRVTALEEATRAESFAETGFIKEAKEDDEDKDDEKENKESSEDDKEKEPEKSEKEKVEESFKETMKSQK